jgi:hypothetical protein
MVGVLILQALRLQADHPLATSLQAKGLKQASLGQRPGFVSAEALEPCRGDTSGSVSPFQGLAIRCSLTQGVALGWLVRPLWDQGSSQLLTTRGYGKLKAEMRPHADPAKVAINSSPLVDTKQYQISKITVWRKKDKHPRKTVLSRCDKFIRITK